MVSVSGACASPSRSSDRSRPLRGRTLALSVLSAGLVLFVVVVLVGCGEDTPPSEERPPNVLFILADDLGYMDVGAYNPETFYETPNIDSLARRGMRFTDGYVANPVCSPTRYSIMTGRYPSRENHTDWFCGDRSGRFEHAEYDCSMGVDQTTLAEAFREGDYATWFGGKWHLGPDPKHWPDRQGFDENVGGYAVGNPSPFGGYFSPWDNPRLQEPSKGRYLPNYLADAAGRFVESHRDERFFAYLSFYEVHNPKQAPDSLIQKYREKRDRQRLDEVEEFEQIDQVWPDAGPRRERVVQGHPVYAAMVEALDTAVGTVLDALRKNGVADNTVVVFLSDNGGLSTSEGHNTSNRPLRGGKGWLYEGGIREPYIIHWPGVTAPGSTTDVPVISNDLYPTLLDIAGLRSRPEQHVDGVSLVPVLRGESSLDREALYWHYPHYSNQGGFPGGAIRVGPWKLIEEYEEGRVRLFNLEKDRGERTNLAGQYPEWVDQLREQLHSWYEDVDARFLRAGEEDSDPWRPGE